MADTSTFADDFQARLSGIYIRVVFAGIIFALNEIANDYFLVFRTIVYNGRRVHRYSRRCQFLLPYIGATISLNLIKGTI